MLNQFFVEHLPRSGQVVIDGDDGHHDHHFDERETRGASACVMRCGHARNPLLWIHDVHIGKFWSGV